jgi:hypothetical protein
MKSKKAVTLLAVSPLEPSVFTHLTGESVYLSIL